MNDSHVAIQALARQRIGLSKRLHDDTIDLQSVRRAWQAATRMQDAMAEFATLETSVGSVALGMKICIGAGDVLGLSAGGGLRWRRCAARRPATRLRRA